MKVAFDTSTLIVSLSANPGAVLDRTGNIIPDAKQRVEFLLTELSESRTQIIIPTPVFSELLARAETAASKYFDIIRNSRQFRLEPFDVRAAIEAGTMTRKALESGLGKRGASIDSWPKVKFDRQIVAIAKVCGVNRIYSEDQDIITIGSSVGIAVIGIANLPLPPQGAQESLSFDKPKT